MAESFVNLSVQSFVHSLSQSSPQSLPQSSIEPLTEAGVILQLADGRIQACNASAERLLGLRSNQAQIFQGDRWQFVQADGVLVACDLHPAAAALQTGVASIDVAMALRLLDGRWTALAVTAQPLFSVDSPEDGSAVPYGAVVMLRPLAPPDQLGVADSAIDSPSDFSDDSPNDSPGDSRFASEQLFATLESISDAFFSLDRDWRFTYVNAQACHLLNRSSEGLLGKSHWEEFPDTIGTVVEQEYHRAVSEGVTVSFEIFYPPLNGWFTVRAYPIRDSAAAQPIGLAVYFQNVTEQKLVQIAFSQQEQTARQRLAEIEAIYATAPVGLCFNDTDLRYVRINQQLAEINGASVEQHIGRTLRELLPELADQLEPIYRRVIETGEPLVNLEVSGTNPAQPGVWRDWLSSYYPLKDKDDRVLGVNVVVQEITEYKRQEADRKRSDEALRQSEERYRTLFDSIDEGFCIIEVLFDEHQAPIDYRFLETNPTFEAQTGLHQAIGKTMRELVPDIENHWIQTYGEVALTGEAVRFENGSDVMNRWFDVYAFRIDPPEQRKVAVLFKDVSDRKQTEVALKESEARFRRMTDAMPLIMWTADPDGTIDYYNQHWEDYTGTSRIGTSDWEWRQIIHPEDTPRTIEIWTEAVLSEAPLHECEHRVRRKDGEYRWHLTRAVPYRNEQGQVVKWFGLAIDIHEQKLAIAERELYADRIKRLLQREKTARTEAESANRVKDEFLAVLSHELRSPLNPILGWTKLLQTGRLNAAQSREALATIERNARLQTQLIEDLLDISRVMRGKLALTPQPTDLAAVISAAADTVRLAAEAKQIQIDLNLDPNLGSMSGDAGRLQQVFWNLLSNAIKFTPNGGRVEVRLQQVGERGEERWGEERWGEERWEEGGGSREQGGDFAAGGTVSQRQEGRNPESGDAVNPDALSISPSSSFLSMPDAPRPTPDAPHPNAPTPLSAQITITDTGKGIHPDFLPHVFDYFRQEDSSTTRQFGGLGLGLAIARQIVELHGGTIEASSAGEGQGATFTVRLPLSGSGGAGEQESGGERKSFTSSVPQPLSGIRVLVVDDDPDTRDFLDFMLNMNGAIVTTAASTTEALRTLKRLSPDILLSDIGMPDQDGYTLMRLIRAAYPDRPIPAIALTAYAADYDRQKALQVGFQQHIAKPIDPDRVIQTILDLTPPPPPPR